MLPVGAVNEHAEPLGWVLVPVSLKKHSQDLYEIDRTRYFVRFRSFAGHRFYSGQQGVMVVGANARQSRFYVQP